MASNPPGRCCTIGVKHEGEAKGKIETISNGMNVHISAQASSN